MSASADISALGCVQLTLCQSIFLEIFPAGTAKIDSEHFYSHLGLGNCLGMKGQKRLQTPILPLEEQYEERNSKHAEKTEVKSLCGEGRNSKEAKQKILVPNFRWGLDLKHLKLSSIFWDRRRRQVLLVSSWEWAWKVPWAQSEFMSSGPCCYFSAISGANWAVRPYSLTQSFLIYCLRKIQMHYAVVCRWHMIYVMGRCIIFFHLMPKRSGMYLNIMTDSWQDISVVFKQTNAMFL